MNLKPYTLAYSLIKAFDRTIQVRQDRARQLRQSSQQESSQLFPLTKDAAIIYFFYYNRFAFGVLAAFLFVCFIFNHSLYYLGYSVLSIYIAFICSMKIKNGEK